MEIENEFLEKLHKFIKYDDLIRKEKMEHKKTIANLEKEKAKFESYLALYLQSKDMDTINIGKNKIKIIEHITKTKDDDSVNSSFKLRRFNKK